MLDEVQLLVRRRGHEILPLYPVYSRTSRPSAPTIVSDNFLPNGGLVSRVKCSRPGPFTRGPIRSGRSRRSRGNADDGRSDVSGRRPGGARCGVRVGESVEGIDDFQLGDAIEVPDIPSRER